MQNERTNKGTPKRIVITGGPSTGKTSIINHLKIKGFKCLEEISRQVTLEARKQGIEQLFLTDPLLFSQKLLEGRIEQHQQVIDYDSAWLFYDRGVPDVIAYMDYIGDDYPSHFVEACKNHRYDKVFVLKPWEAIYQSDNERYENFDQAVAIHDHLVNTYQRFGYDLFDVPFDSVENRTQYIVEHIEQL